MSDLTELTEIFEILGMPRPREWAASQLNEGINQIARATALRGLADIVTDSDNTLELCSNPTFATSEVLAAMKRLSSLGADKGDLSLIVKTVMYHSISDVMAIFDGSAVFRINPADINVGWFAVDNNFEPSTDTLGLHESWSSVAVSIIGEDVVKHW